MVKLCAIKTNKKNTVHCIAKAYATPFKNHSYPLYTSPKDPFPISSKEVNLDPAASANPAASAILLRSNHYQGPHNRPSQQALSKECDNEEQIPTPKTDIHFPFTTSDKSRNPKLRFSKS